jgi:AcrR family transcriptional regulator
LPENAWNDLKHNERDARRRLILDAARDLFAEKDFKSVTVREIAKSAGVSIGTIYNYYDNITELFLDVFLTNAEQITHLIRQEYQTAPPSLPRLCDLYVTFLNDNMTFYQMMGHFMLGGELPPAATDRLNRVMRSLMDRIDDIVKASGISEPARHISHALFSALNGIMISYAGYPGRTAPEIKAHTLRLAGVVADVFHSGLKNN